MTDTREDDDVVRRAAIRAVRRWGQQGQTWLTETPLTDRLCVVLWMLDPTDDDEPANEDEGDQHMTTETNETNPDTTDLLSEMWAIHVDIVTTLDQIRDVLAESLRAHTRTLVAIGRLRSAVDALGQHADAAEE